MLCQIVFCFLYTHVQHRWRWRALLAWTGSALRWKAKKVTFPKTNIRYFWLFLMFGISRDLVFAKCWLYLCYLFGLCRDAALKRDEQEKYSWWPPKIHFPGSTESIKLFWQYCWILFFVIIILFLIIIPNSLSIRIKSLSSSFSFLTSSSFSSLLSSPF